MNSYIKLDFRPAKWIHFNIILRRYYNKQVSISTQFGIQNMKVLIHYYIKWEIDWTFNKITVKIKELCDTQMIFEGKANASQFKIKCTLLMWENSFFYDGTKRDVFASLKYEWQRSRAITFKCVKLFINTFMTTSIFIIFFWKRWKIGNMRKKIHISLTHAYTHMDISRRCRKKLHIDG